VPRLVELSHAIEDGMPTLPGVLPPVHLGALITREESRPRYQGRAEFLLARIDIPANSGTYMDAPFHRYEDGDDTAAISLERVADLPGIVLDGRPGAGRGIDLEATTEDLVGRAVLVRTGWSERWGTEGYWEPGPHLSADALDLLVAAGPALVGVDFVNVDDTGDPSRPAHTRLLREGILVVEHLTGLDELPRTGFRFTAVPLPLVGGAASPVRAFAAIP
jgi:arylformamidase